MVIGGVVVVVVVVVIIVVVTVGEIVFVVCVEEGVSGKRFVRG